MTVDGLSAVAGVIVSLLFSYVPGLREWYGGLSKQHKQSVMGAVLVVVAGGIFGVTCTGVYDVGIDCTQGGAIGLAETLIAALVANQSTYLITRSR